jgi:fructose-1,6-bisphosphatase/sedoheptulose 1,7-bisphosphatase-like protein
MLENVVFLEVGIASGDILTVFVLSHGLMIVQLLCSMGERRTVRGKSRYDEGERGDRNEQKALALKRS